MRAQLSDALFPPAALSGGLPAPALCTVEDVMSREVICVRPDTSLETVVELMLDHGISGMPVVDAAGRLVGLVSKTDLVRRQATGGEEPPAPAVLLASASAPEDSLHLLDGATAADVMTREVLTVPAGAPLSEVAQTLVLGGVHRLPVLARNGMLVGLVSTSDLVRWVAGLP